MIRINIGQENFIRIDEINKKLPINEEEGEIICPNCNGWGHLYHKRMGYISTCSHCAGAGKMDWIDNATGGLMNTGTAAYTNNERVVVSRNGKYYPVVGSYFDGRTTKI